MFLSKNKQIKDRRLVKMNNTRIEQQNQIINPDKLGIFGDYFSRLKVGSMLNKSGIMKLPAAQILVVPTKQCGSIISTGYTL